MAFLTANFSPIGANSKRGVAPQYFSYKTTDSLNDCDTAGYFNGLSTKLEVGDSIYVAVVDSVSATTAVTAKGELIVASNSGGVVDTYDAGNTITIADNR